MLSSISYRTFGKPDNVGAGRQSGGILSCDDEFVAGRKLSDQLSLRFVQNYNVGKYTSAALKVREESLRSNPSPEQPSRQALHARYVRPKMQSKLEMVRRAASLPGLIGSTRVAIR